MTITAPSLALSARVSCPKCQVAQSIDGLSRVYWCPSTLHLTLDTISIVVTQYNNTRLTSTTTEHGNVSTMDIFTIAEASSLVYYYKNLNKYPAVSFSMVNGIDGKIGTTSFEWPQPYLAIDAFWYKTAKPNSFCPLGAYADNAGGSCLCVFDNDVKALINPGYNRDWLSSTIYPLHTTLLQPLNAYASQPNMDNRGEDSFFSFNNISFSAWLMSNTVFKSSLPDLRSCTFLPLAMGPPAIKIPVAALTTTTITTIQSSGYYGHSITPKPAVVPTKPEARQTFQSSSSPNPTITGSAEGSREPISLVPEPSAPIPQSRNSQGVTTQFENLQSTINQHGSNSGENAQNGENPSKTDHDQNISAGKAQSTKSQGGNHDSNDDNKTDRVSLSLKLEVFQSISDPPVITPGAANPAPEIQWAGSTIKPDESSHYDLPGIGNISPGGPALTTNNVVYSLAPSATAILSNGKTFPLTPVTAIAPQPQQTPKLVVAGLTYTADSSNRFLLASQTLVPGGTPAFVAGTRVSIAPGGTVAVVGSTTQVLGNPAPGQAAAFTFAGSTYAIGSSDIIVAGQTLKPGGSGIVVSGTPISLAEGGKFVVVGSNTQSSIGATRAPRVSPIITIDGSRYTANAASQYVVSGQTLTPGGAITVASKPIFLGFGGSILVVDSSSVLLANPPQTQGSPQLTFAGSIYTANPFGDFIVAGQTLTPGGGITVSGTGITLSPGGTIAVVGGSTQLVRPAAVTEAPALTLGGSTFTANNAGQFLIGGKTLALGGDITVSGTHISLSPNGIISIDGSSSQFLTPFHVIMKPVLSFNGSTYTADGSLRFVIDGQALSQGAGIAVHGTTLSIPSGKNYVIIGSSTQDFSTATVPFVEAPMITFAGSTYAENSLSEFVIDGQTLTKGGFITVQGSRISFDLDGSSIVVGTSTQDVLAAITRRPATAIMITFGGSTYLEDSSSEFIIDGQTLSRGGVITAQGSRISFNSDGSNVVVGTSTQKVSIGSIAGPAAPVITFGGSAYLENSASDFVIDGQTLSKGGVITVDGTPVSFPAAGTAILVMGGDTGTDTVGLGGLIMSGINGPSTPTTAAGGASVSIFRGGGNSERGSMWTLVLLEMVSFLVLDILCMAMVS